MKKTAVLLFDKFEEIEGITPVDILRRAGVDVKTLSVEPTKTVVGRSSIEVKCDALFEDAKGEIFDALVISGGPGTDKLLGREDVLEFVRRHNAEGKICAAICAAPVVLKAAGVLEGRRRTAFPARAAEVGGCDESVPAVVDRNIITSRGAGTASEFAFAIVSALLGEDAARKVAESICFSRADRPA